MSKYIKLKKYIVGNIESINSQLEELSNLRMQLDDAQSLSLILSNDFVSINNDNIKLLGTLLNDDFNVSIKKILICLPYFTDNVLGNEPQVVNARYMLADIIKKLEDKIEDLQFRIDSFRSDDVIMLELNTYLNYLTLFDDNGFIKALDTDNVDSFLDFVRSAPLDISKDELLDLIMEFATYNLDHHIKKLESNTALNQSIVSQNSREIFSEIDKMLGASSSDELESIPDKIEIDLKEDEVSKLNAITLLVEDLKSSYNGINTDISEFVDGNDFSLKLRVDLYDSALTKDEMWNMILQDLTKFLIPCLSKDKDSIMKIFDHILNLYNKEFINSNINEGVVLYKFSEEDTEVIKKARELLDQFSDEFDQYSRYDKTDKNSIDSVYQLILENNYENLDKVSDKFSLVYIKFIKKLISLRESVSSLTEILDKEEEHRLECGNEEVNEIISIILQDIYSDVIDIVLLDEQRNNIEVEEKEEDIEDINSLEGAKNLLVFLPRNNSHNSYYYEEDKDEILRREKAVLSDVSNGLDILMSYNVVNKVEKSDSIRRIVSKSLPKFIKKEIKPFTYRKSNSIIAFSMLPLSQNNKQTLMKMFGLSSDNINVILIMDFAIECASQDIYDDVLNRMVRGRKEIKNIQDVFGNDFNNQTMVTASELIQHGFIAIDNIHRACGMDGRSKYGK